MSVETKTVDVEDAPRWQRLIAWLGESYGRHMVEIRRDGEPVAYLAGPEFAGLIAKLSGTWHDREAPFTQEALHRWTLDVLSTVSVTELLSGRP